MTVIPDLSDLFSSTSSPLAILEADGIITACNAAWSEVLRRLQVSGGEMGDNFAALFRTVSDEGQDGTEEDAVRTFLAGTLEPFSCSLPLPGNKVVPFRLTLVPGRSSRRLQAEIHPPPDQPQRHLACLPACHGPRSYRRDPLAAVYGKRGGLADKIKAKTFILAAQKDMDPSLQQHCADEKGRR